MKVKAVISIFVRDVEKYDWEEQGKANMEIEFFTEQVPYISDSLDSVLHTAVQEFESKNAENIEEDLEDVPLEE